MAGNAKVAESGGYDVEFVDKHVSEQDINCSICLLVLKEPMQANPCGHRFCKSCIDLEKKRQRSRKLVCPNDRGTITIFPDKGRQREILQLKVNCSNSGPSKCDWVGELKVIEAHIEECPFQVIDCENGCGLNKILRENMGRHLDEECPKTILPCPFASVGCEFKCMRREIKEHMKTSTVQHLGFQITNLNNRLSTLEEDLVKEKDNYKRLKEESETETAQLKAKIRKLESTSRSRCPFTFTVQHFKSKRKKRQRISSDIFEYFDGYRARLSLDFGEDKSVGLYLKIVSGPFDDILPWPVLFDKISMKCFINRQCIKNMSIKHREELKEVFLKPPKDGDGKAWGIPIFLKDDEIPENLHNNTIKFVVDITEKK